MKKSPRKDSSSFLIYNIFSSGKATISTQDRFLIVAHRDLDGLISAFLLAVAIRDSYSVIDVIFSQPYMASSLRNFLVQRDQLDTYCKFGFVDLSVDCTKPRTTKNLFTSLGRQVEYVFDHHVGWDTMIKSTGATKLFNVTVDDHVLSEVPSSRCVVIGKSTCCAHLIYNHFNLAALKNSYLDDLLIVAMLSDDLHTRQLYKGTAEYTTFINFRNNTLETCLGQIKANTSVANIKGLNGSYSRVIDAAEAALLQAEEIYPKVAYVKTFARSSLNYTALCERAYAVDYNVVIIKELDPRRMRISYTVAHNMPEVDLVAVFGLNGGNPRRITLYKKNCVARDILERLKPYLEEHNPTIVT